MRRESQALPMVLVAALLLGLGLTDVHLLYVKPAMRPLLVAAGVLTAVLAVARYRIVPADPDEVADDEDHAEGDADADDDADDAVEVGAHDLGEVGDDDPDPAGHDDAGDDPGPAGHDHAGHPGGWLPWLLALPFLLVVLVTPRPLGAYLAARQSPRVPPPAAVGAYPPLPAAVDGAHALTLMEFTSRARYGPEHQMIGKVVRLTGFVTPAPAGEDGFRLTRFVLSCCAGDGTAYQVRVRTPGGVPPPPADTWLVVEGTWRPARSGDQPEVPTLVAATLRQVPQPADPYER